MLQIDSYSAFFDNGGFSHTELNDKLKGNNINTVIVTGLALDYCVFYTAKDAKKLGQPSFINMISQKYHFCIILNYYSSAHLLELSIDSSYGAVYSMFSSLAHLSQKL
jgi:isochorismate hydrolase